MLEKWQKLATQIEYVGTMHMVANVKDAVAND